MNPQRSIEQLDSPESSNIVLINQAVNREQIEQFAWRCFNASYGADLKDFLPNMLALVDSEGHINASAGYQSASGTTLYLEHYCELPIEAMIQHRLGLSKTPQRSQILEVGNLAAKSAGATRRLILSLSQFFQHNGFKWLVITATPKVRQSFEKLNLGLNLFPVAEAHASNVRCKETDWGTYYDQRPHVFVGDIDSGMQALCESSLFKRIIQRLPMPIDDNRMLIKE